MALIPLQRQQPNRSSKQTSGYVATDHAEAHLAQVASTIAAADTSGDMFSMLAVDDIMTRSPRTKQRNIVASCL